MATKKKPKNYWNYRVMVIKVGKEKIYGMYEVYYKNDKPESYSAEPVRLETLEDIKQIKWLLKKFKEATKKPIIWTGSKFPQEVKQSKK
jgi:hypothetical protein